MQRRIISLILISAAVIGCRAKVANEEKAVMVAGFVTQETEMPTVIDVSGRITPQNKVSVYSQIPGKVVEVLAQEGDRVSKGKTLARVKQDLPGSHYRPHQVLSPIEGVVIRALASQGATINPQTPLFEVADDRCINFVGHLYGEEQNRIRTGQRLLITRHGDTLFGMSVSRISPEVDPLTGGQKIEATVCLLKKPVLIGQEVDGIVLSGKLKGIAIPRISLVSDSTGQPGVFIIEGEKARFQPVKILNRAEEFFLVEGLEEGKTVAAEGVSELFSGSRVMVRTNR